MYFFIAAIETFCKKDLSPRGLDSLKEICSLSKIPVIAIGVGIFLALAIVRILLQISLSVILTVLYIALIIISFFVPSDFLAVAFDSGGVTTGPMTVPFIMAMGVGLASVRSDKIHR